MPKKVRKVELYEWRRMATRLADRLAWALKFVKYEVPFGGSVPFGGITYESDLKKAETALSAYARLKKKEEK